MNDKPSQSLNIQNPLRSSETVRQLNPDELNIPINAGNKESTNNQWDELFDLAKEAANRNTVGAAAATVNGDLSNGAALTGKNSGEVHAIELAVWNAYLKHQSPVQKIVVFTNNSEFKPCNRCLSVIRDYAAAPTIRIVNIEGENQREYSDIESLLSNIEIEDSNHSQKSDDIQSVQQSPSQAGNEADDSLDVEYIRFPQGVYHLKYKGIDSTFCGRDLKGEDYRRSDTEPELLDSCKDCTGESSRKTLEERMADARKDLCDLVVGVQPSSTDPGTFSNGELNSILDAVPTEFPDFERSNAHIRYNLSWAIRDVADESHEPNTFKIEEMKALIDAISDGRLISSAMSVFVYTEQGYVKRTPLSEYEMQRRAGKGLVGANLEEDDSICSVFIGNPRDNVLLFTDEGKVYTTKAYEIPESPKEEVGVQFSAVIDLDSNESVQQTLMMRNLEDNDYIAMVTRDGYFKRTGVTEFENIHSGGIKAVDLDEDEIRGISWTDGSSDIFIETQEGQSIRFNESDARPMGRSARGVVGIELESTDEVTDLTVIDQGGNTEILTITRNGFGKRTPTNEYRVQSRKGKGLLDITTGDRNGPVVAVKTVKSENSVLIFSKNGRLIHIPRDDISVVGRNTKGVLLMRLNEGDKIAEMDLA
ncbi:hypothetical protein KM295_15035 [Natronomonas sp. F2-12]|uniref:CMP/dCMP-type deaminase domain-containing protein n=1 Tax=Natronomonas aquatica TaxID=2841590 RepID=A0A9R1CW01_9EURY|nr:DNA gyrase C-terminal beta-propeller domain-containing protein [Natronomonas aquatica]MCQ4334767.1 hypothetical protein [Natronomonas aquatica]